MRIRFSRRFHSRNWAWPERIYPPARTASGAAASYAANSSGSCSRCSRYHRRLRLPQKVFSGSCIDKTFQYWIGDVEKNKAWNYLKQTSNDYENFAKTNKNHPNLLSAKREILIAEGSDWFWWYGEPNNSGQDHIFDYLFREHLKNVYRILDLDCLKHYIHLLYQW